MTFFIRFYALFAYCAFLGAFGYFVGFVVGFGVPKSLDDGPPAPLWLAVAIDLGLVLFFGLAHSLMARAGFKRVWTRLVPPTAERSTYVLVASAQLALLCWQWRPVGTVHLWSCTGSLALAAHVLQGAGWTMVLLSTFLIDHFELFGLRQAFGGSPKTTELRTPLLYRWVRHPLYFGMLLAFWSTPTMSVGHLLFSTFMSVYILIGVHHEERDLVRLFGDDYRQYQLAVPRLIPRPPRSSSSPLAGPSVSK